MQTNTAEPPIAAGPSLRQAGANHPPRARGAAGILPGPGPQHPRLIRGSCIRSSLRGPSLGLHPLGAGLGPRDILIPEIQLYYPVFVTDELSFAARKRWEELPESTGRESQLGLRSLPHVFISPSVFLLPPPSLPFALCFSPPHSSLSHG